MKRKAVVLIAWSVSVLLVGWLGCVAGVRLGVKLGMAQFHNEHVRRFQLDLADAAKTSDSQTHEVLLTTAELAGAMGDVSRYEKASEVFTAKIKDLQNQSLQRTAGEPGGR